MPRGIYERQKPSELATRTRIKNLAKARAAKMAKHYAHQFDKQRIVNELLTISTNCIKAAALLRS